MSREEINIMIAGEAGQGLASISEILCKALVRAGYKIAVRQDYMSRIRGGHNFFLVRAAVFNPPGPREGVNLLLALDKQSKELHEQELEETGLLIADQELKVSSTRTTLSPPLKQLASARFQNTVCLAILAAVIGLDREILRTALHDYFGKKSEDIARKNDEALEKGLKWAEAQSLPESLKLDPPSEQKSRIMLNGNQALALGALAGGLKFYSFYPMTPATSIANTLAAYLDRLPLVVEQAEDEIAAINMAIGAAYAGAPAMVGTSGGGFALMCEGVSLAGASETPLVIAVAQRPGPATGLPTRTEQGDLELALYAGHGEFPRAILAPGTVEQCFSHAALAFHLAEESQSPVIILTDQFLADSFRAVDPEDLKGPGPVKPGAEPKAAASPYRRYAFTESGISPRLLPGRSKEAVVADSHEHYEDGHIAEDADNRVKMVKKRLRKAEILRQKFAAPEYLGAETPDLLFVCWGSCRGPVIEAAERLRERGRKTAALHFSQVWPLVPGTFLSRLEKAARVVMVEQNATSQFAKLLRQETGFHIERRVLRFDGRPMTPEYILGELGEEPGG